MAPNSVYCGVAVMYYMRELASGNTLKGRFVRTTSLEMRAHLVEQFTMAPTSTDPTTLPDSV